MTESLATSMAQARKDNSPTVPGLGQAGDKPNSILDGVLRARETAGSQSFVLYVQYIHLHRAQAPRGPCLEKHCRQAGEGIF